MPVEAPFRVQVTVRGMTCQHCVLSVTEEICEIDGVGSVDVQLADGTVTVLADRALSVSELAAAVTEAGFQLAD